MTDTTSINLFKVLAAALDDDVAVLMLTHVNYQTGTMFDMAAATAL